MKDGIHPEYRDVVFQDIGADFSFITRSTIAARDTIKWTDGKEYPLVKIEVSSKSHPFYTGKQMILDTAGRVDKFRKNTVCNHTLQSRLQISRQLRLPFLFSQLKDSTSITQLHLIQLNFLLRDTIG